jgi:prepilin-type N-terminal cleavage/methylation domain-containing protein
MTRPNGQAGFTLIEILVATVIAVVVIGAAASLALDVTGFGSSLGSRLEQEMELEPFLRSVLTELRSMGPAENGAYPVAQAEAQTLTFYTDADNDGTFERVRYYLDGTTLKKGVIEPTETQPATYPPASEVVTDVVRYMVPSTIFTYFPEGFPPELTPMTAPVNIANIRLITVTGTIDRDPAVLPGPTTLSISATVRNLRGDI